jgi:hypothetical protein
MLVLKKIEIMKTINKIVALLFTLFVMGACNDTLDLESLTEPTDANFFSNEQELDLALTGVYNSVVWKGGYNLPVQVNMDNGGTDIGLVRGGFAGFDELGAGSHSASTTGFRDSYSNLYRGIGRANNLLQNMERAQEVVPEEKFNQIRAEALVLRAYFYHYLMELFGDVPYTEKLATSSEEALLPRVDKATIADNLLADLETAAAMLPPTQSDPGRITSGFAIGLRARIALYNNKLEEAAASAKAVIKFYN